MALTGGPAGKGTMLAIGVVLLWFAGFCLFIAFMGPRSASLAIGTDQNGAPSSPRNISDVVRRVAANAQALENTNTTSGGGQ